jgi:hypothetical protein
MSDYDFSRNNSFRSADAAPLARRLNVPFVLMSLAARRKAPHAASASPEPTEMRRTLRSVSWCPYCKANLGTFAKKKTK